MLGASRPRAASNDRPIFQDSSAPANPRPRSASSNAPRMVSACASSRSFDEVDNNHPLSCRVQHPTTLGRQKWQNDSSRSIRRAPTGFHLELTVIKAGSAWPASNAADSVSEKSADIGRMQRFPIALSAGGVVDFHRIRRMAPQLFVQPVCLGLRPQHRGRVQVPAPSSTISLPPLTNFVQTICGAKRRYNARKPYPTDCGRCGLGLTSPHETQHSSLANARLRAIPSLTRGRISPVSDSDGAVLE